METSFLGCVLVSLLSISGLVQQIPTDLKPLEVSNVAVERDTSSGVPSMLRFNLTNKSSKWVDAYVVQIDYLDASKQMRNRSARLSGKGVLPSSKPPGYAPGETWSVHFSFPRVVSKSDGTSLLTGEVKIAVDYVAFDDGSTSGPDSAKRSLELRGIKSGVLWERDRLNELLKEKGTDAVLKDLARPIAH